MKVRNDELYSSMKAYVMAAIDFVVSRTRQDPSFDEDHFSWYWNSARSSADLSKVPNYNDCLRLLKDDEVIRNHLNQRIGSTPSAEGLMKLVLDLGRAKNEYNFDPDRFDKQYLIFEETFYSNVQLCYALAPIEGLLWDAEPLHLCESIEISQLKQEEMPWGWTDESIHWNSLWCAVRLKYELPKFYRDINDQNVHLKQQREAEDIVRDQIDYVINSLRVFSNCADFYCSVIILQKPKWAHEQTRQIRNRVLGSGLGNYLLNNLDTLEFREFWSHLEQADVREHVGIAIRRLGDSCIRHRNDDKIVDLMIAAESLFLRKRRGGSKGVSIAELAANCLGATDEAKKKIEQRLRLAYQLRNAIVHEGKFNGVPGVVMDDMEDFVGTTQMLLRAAIFHKVRELTV